MSAEAIDYGDFEVRADLRAAHARVLDHLRRPGSWLTGAERLGIATESRRATSCALCTERRAALSPDHVQGEHAAVASLDPALVDVAHRVRTDPGRVSRRWFDALRAGGLEPGAYVEAVGVVAFTAGLDAFGRALGGAPFALPTPVEGAPSRHWPEGLRDGGAWVPLLQPEDARGPDADVYAGVAFAPNILKALSCVPEHVRVLREWLASHYTLDLMDLTVGRAIDRAQMELVASRVSALNECFY